MKLYNILFTGTLQFLNSYVLFYQIDVVKDLPVGQQVENHVAVRLRFTLKQTSPVEVKKSFTFEALFNQLFTGKGDT